MAILTGPEIRRLATPVPARDLCNEFVFHDGQPRQVLAASHAADYSDVCLAVGGVRQWERMDADRLLQRCGPRGERLAIKPFDPARCGPNSYDVHLGDVLLVYVANPGQPIDPLRPPPTAEVPLGHDGRWLIEPGRLYLGSTREHIEQHGLVPTLHGRSSIGRLGLAVHVTAGLGDDGVAMNWTFELVAVQPVLLGPGMRIAQVSFQTITGERRPYDGRYQNDTTPTASRYHLADRLCEKRVAGG